MRTIFSYVVLGLIVSWQPSAHAVKQQSSSQQQEIDPQFGRERQKDPTAEKLERDREKALNKQRQTSLQKDTDRLLQLATELKQNVDKSNEHTLSLDVIKKAEEIEKLAKQVKDKMKGSY
jgi:predicted TIM-barrel fold metal-dependent hydrolase